MRSFTAIAAASLGACSAASPTQPHPPVHGETPGFTCRDEGLSGFVGRQATAEIGAEIRQRAGARALRWIPRGAAITMDLRMDRVNVRLDARNRIESVSCG